MVDLGLWVGESYRIPGEDRESERSQPGKTEEPDDPDATGHTKKILH